MHERGFRKLRGFRDQILSLILLAQIGMSEREKGMFATFVDYRKAYDRVNREKIYIGVSKECWGGRSYGILLALLLYEL